MSAVTCLSPCKINLFLYITGRRPDGYHELETLFAILDYGDEMSFELTDSGDLEIEGPFDFPKEKNLIYKAYKLLCSKLEAQGRSAPGALVKVKKRIPDGAGLGGGSSNAATTLLVLNRLFKLNLSLDELAALGASLGADVPVFVRGENAFAEGIGDKLTPVDISCETVLVVTPKASVNTKAAYSDPDLKRDSPKRGITGCIVTPYDNDFTKSVIKTAPQVGQCLTRLLKYGPAQMSGSGSSCFVLFSSFQEAQRAAEELSHEDFRAVFTAQIVRRSPVFDVLDALKA